MPLYTYRRADGTTFDIKQKFSDDPLKVDPQTGQSVNRVVYAAGIIFKGSGFYVNDSKRKSTSTLNSSSHAKDSSDSNGTSTDSAKSESETKTETKAETKSESKTETKSEAKPEKKAAPSTAAAD
jgi:predicted nucleic acid-binding Zn ribbon protein